MAAAKAKNIKIITDFPDELIAYYDSDMMKIIIRNLINNAMKYSYENTDVIVSGREKNGLVEISVKDSGTGMDEETRANLFRIDVKNKSEIGTRGEKGSGLGLILCREFILKHNGAIRVESEPGKGSEFIFTIPG
jgi:signal transduction histidine kinase